jgi:lysyl-tRNA synthetase class 2
MSFAGTTPKRARVATGRTASLPTTTRHPAPRRDPDPSDRRAVHGWRTRVPGISGAILLVLAAICAAASVSEAVFSHSQVVRQAIDDVILPAPANLAYAAFTGILGVSLRRRKRLALDLLFGYLALPLLADLGVLAFPDSLGRIVSRLAWLSRSPAYTTATTAANLVIVVGAAVLLWLARRQFDARVQPASGRRAFAVGVGGVVGATLAGWALLSASPGSLRPGDRLVYALEKVLGGALVFDTTRNGQAPGWVDLLLGLGGAATIFAVMLTLLAAQRSATTINGDDEERIRSLIARHGRDDSLGYFATRRDKSVVFSSSGKAAVTYRVAAGVCVASGDPLGDPEAWRKAVDAWLELSRRYAWTPAVLGASRSGAIAYARGGLRVLEVGDEAIIDVATFTLDGRDMRTVRQAVARVGRAGYELRIRRYAEIPAAEWTRIAQLAAAWRGSTNERGFSMALGRMADPDDGRCLLVEAIDPTGEPAAVMSFVPWGDDGLSLDLMRRARTGDNGLIEFMVAELTARSAALNVRRISLNFAVFRSVFENGSRLGAGPMIRAWRRCLVFASRWLQLESLYRANAKYQPRWVPRYLCFDDHGDLAKVLTAVAFVEGFVALPRVKLWPRRHRADT